MKERGDLKIKERVEERKKVRIRNKECLEGAKKGKKEKEKRYGKITIKRKS